MNNPIRIGWKCPRCGGVNSPDVPRCNCEGHYVPPPIFKPTPQADCGCPLSYVCMSTACPRRLNVTCQPPAG